MIDISLNIYRIFYITAQSKTISEASEKLCISQPAVSKSIKKLEELLDVKLLYRSKNGIELTKNGTVLYEYIDKCYNYLVAGQKMIEDLKTLKRGSLTIGVPSHIACFYVLDYIKKFTDKYSNIKVRLVSNSTKFLISELYNHKLDMVIDSPPINIFDDNIVIKKIDEFETIFISNNTISDNELTIKNFNKYNYILPYNNSSTYKALKKKLNEQNIVIESMIEVDTTDVIISSVKLGLGIGYVVKKAVSEELKAKRIKELITTIDLPKLQLNLVYMKNYVTSVSKEFIKYLLEDKEKKR